MQEKLAKLSAVLPNIFNNIAIAGMVRGITYEFEHKAFRLKNPACLNN